jgi:photosystem II stability/assembly factor-like uncharacterized protein
MLATALVLVLVGAVVGVVGVVAATRDNNPKVSVTNHGTSTTIAPTSSTKPGVVATSTSTSTTTTPTRLPSHAVSASFVSPQHGWVLEQNGSVAESTDGGMNWRALGSVGALAENFSGPRIRFADTKRGFVYTDRNLLTTGDGGAHWQRLDTPFGPVTDLAISRGVVYLVSYDQKANDFALWSSPVDQVAWSNDALTLPVGAGPVPVQQLVFSGGNGWVTNGDRGISGGARLSASGHWETWKPPCLGASASVAASSATDMAASCEEGVWTGPKITHSLYFSHDGGASFQRRVVPFSGSVASPDSSSAIVATSGGLERTTDEGATWQLVAGGATYSALDLGFTTSTQGFVIYANGPMLMTYDAGATWSAVTLP